MTLVGSQVLTEDLELSYKATLAASPGDPLFAEYAQLLVKAGRSSEAVPICLAGLSLNPAVIHGRLALAWAYYEQGYLPFCREQLAVLSKELPGMKYLEKLITALGISQGDDAKEAQIVAEADFSLDDLSNIKD